MSHPERNRLAVLLFVYLAAILLHFVHNAEFLGDYPNLPNWLTRSHVYLAWLGSAAIGVCGLILYLRGWLAFGLLMIGAYAASGFDGLAHYLRAPFSAHTDAMNFTIWIEVVAASVLLVAVVFAAVARLHRNVMDS